MTADRDFLELTRRMDKRMDALQDGTSSLSSEVDGRLNALERDSHVHKDPDTMVPGEPTPEVAAIVARLQAVEGELEEDNLDARTTALEERFLELEAHLRTMEARLTAIPDQDERDQLNARVDGLARSQEALEAGLDTLTPQGTTTELASRVAAVEAQLGQKANAGAVAAVSRQLGAMVDQADEANLDGRLTGLLDRLVQAERTLLSVTSRMDALEEGRELESKAQAILTRVVKVEAADKERREELASVGRRHDRLTRRMDKDRPNHLQPESILARLELLEPRVAAVEEEAKVRTSNALRLDELEGQVAKLATGKATASSMASLRRDVNARLQAQTERMDTLEADVTMVGDRATEPRLQDLEGQVARLAGKLDREGGRGEPHLAPPPAEPPRFNPPELDPEEVARAVRDHLPRSTVELAADKRRTREPTDAEMDQEVDARTDPRWRPEDRGPFLLTQGLDVVELVTRLEDVLRDHSRMGLTITDQAEAIVDYLRSVRWGDLTDSTPGPSQSIAGQGQPPPSCPPQAPSLAPGRPMTAGEPARDCRATPSSRPSTGLLGASTGTVSKLRTKLQEMARWVRTSAPPPTSVADELDWTAQRVAELTPALTPPEDQDLQLTIRLRSGRLTTELTATDGELEAKLTELERSGRVRRTGYLPDHPSSPESKARRATLEEVRDHVMERMEGGFTDLGEVLDILQAMEDEAPCPDSSGRCDAKPRETEPTIPIDPDTDWSPEEVTAEAITSLRAVAAGKGREDMTTLMVNPAELAELADRLEVAAKVRQALLAPASAEGSPAHRLREMVGWMEDSAGHVPSAMEAMEELARELELGTGPVLPAHRVLVLREAKAALDALEVEMDPEDQAAAEEGLAAAVGAVEVLIREVDHG